MLPYFPFGQRFNDKMGTVPLLENDRLIEVDKHYVKEVTLKRQLLDKHQTYYFQALRGSEKAQWDVLTTVLQHLARFAPAQFTLQQQETEWCWTNHLLAETTRFIIGDASTLPTQPLDWVGRQVQEDLILLAGDEAQLVAGQLCFANDWCLDDKMGLPFWHIHEPVIPIVEPMLQAAQKLMERLPVGRPVWRANWSVKSSDQLDMTSRHATTLKQQFAQQLPHFTSENIGDHLYLRVERQTLTRLPQSNAILFGIHTYQNLLAHETADPERAKRLEQVFSTTPPAMLTYKGMVDYLPMLLVYLRSRMQ